MRLRCTINTAHADLLSERFRGGDVAVNEAHRRQLRRGHLEKVVMRVQSRLAYGLRFTAALSALIVCGGLSPSRADDPGDFQGAYGARPSFGSIATGLELAALLPPGMQKPVHIAGPPRAFMSPAVAAIGQKRFFSDANNGAVLIYNAAGTLVGTVTGFGSPEGLATDKAGRLYVTDEAYSQVDVFAPPYNGTPTYLSDSGQSPVSTAVDGAGNVAGRTSIPRAMEREASASMPLGQRLRPPPLRAALLRKYSSALSMRTVIFIWTARTFTAMRFLARSSAALRGGRSES